MKIYAVFIGDDVYRIPQSLIAPILDAASNSIRLKRGEKWNAPYTRHEDQEPFLSRIEIVDFEENQE